MSVIQEALVYEKEMVNFYMIQLVRNNQFPILITKIVEKIVGRDVREQVEKPTCYLSSVGNEEEFRRYLLSGFGIHTSSNDIDILCKMLKEIIDENSRKEAESLYESINIEFR